MLDVYISKIDELKKRHEPFALATVVRRQAPSSGKPGDKAVINRLGEMFGWVGGGCVKGILLKEAEDAMKSGKPRLVRIGKELENQFLGEIKEYKMTCQSEGMVEVFVEPVVPQPHLVVVGKSMIAKSLVRLAKAAGYRVTGVAQDANLQTFEKVDELITQLKLDNVKTTPASCIVVATQGDQDEKALMDALRKDAAYIGFVASRKKVESLRAYLFDAGIDVSRVEALHSPAGIDILARQPDEVAISILAEITLLRNSGRLPQAFEGYAAQTEVPMEAPKWYINPVCGVPVDMNNPKHVVEYNGEKVYFCCDGCKVKFDKDPAKYIQMRELGLQPEGM
ncbi:MAG TPA: XdhC family protein [Phnomibacter sp.]|nr:XdhC family protein [Phnomibacter sp.]